MKLWILALSIISFSAFSQVIGYYENSMVLGNTIASPSRFGFMPRMNHCEALKHKYVGYYERLILERGNPKLKLESKDEDEQKLIEKLRAVIKNNPNISYEVFFMQNISADNAERCLIEVNQTPRRVSSVPTGLDQMPGNVRSANGIKLPRPGAKKFRNPQTGLFPTRPNFRNAVNNPHGMVNSLFYRGGVNQE